MAEKKSTIHIKPENKGLFTKYCQGLGEPRVTSKCIAKGKSSNSKKVRARAVFADNAKKWN